MESAETQRVVHEILTDYLVQNHMRKTPERYAILEAIYRQAGLFTVEKLFEVMDERFHVSLATIYNALDLFVRIGLVVRHSFGPHAYYEKCYGVRDHFVQVCTHCGEVTSFHSPPVSAALSAARLRRFRPEQFTIAVYGICSKCQARITRRRNRMEQLQQG